MQEHYGPLADEIASATARAAAWIPRIWQRDHTVWQDDPTEVADRLGWLSCPTGFRSEVAGLRDFASGVVGDGIEHVLLVGMGGSSLYPEVLSQMFGAAAGHPRLHVLDSTDPAAVRRVRSGLPWDRTLLVAASKSGTTTETRSHLGYFSQVLADEYDGSAARRCVAVTDPGSALAELAAERGFRACFENPTDIGGRFSALSYFGLVPGALLGLDLAAHLDAAAEMADVARATAASDNAPLRLGAAMGAAVRAGRDKLTVLLPDDWRPFGAWIEQLVAESTGKRGTGLLPIVDEPLLDPDAYGDDRLFVSYLDPERIRPLAAAGHPVVSIPVAGVRELAAEVFRWEFATAVAGGVLGINPFDQPNVQSAKTATNRMLEDGFDRPAPRPADRLLDLVEPGDYVALLAFVDPGGEVAAALPDVADALRRRTGVPVTVGIGPRYLHSTGQLHKGGPDEGVFLVVAGDDPRDEPIPGRPYTFGTLKHAQAVGDLEALAEAGRRAGLVAADDLLAVLG